MISEEKKRGRATGAAVSDDLEVDVGRGPGADGFALLGANLAKWVQVEFFFRHPVKERVLSKVDHV